MLKKERQAHILHRVNVHNRVLSGDLCTEMSVSEDTIRRDLNELSEQGKIIKVHGGALSKSFHSSLQPTDVYSQDKKIAIARKAARLPATARPMSSSVMKTRSALVLPPASVAVCTFTGSPAVRAGE